MEITGKTEELNVMRRPETVRFSKHLRDKEEGDIWVKNGEEWDSPTFNASYTL